MLYKIHGEDAVSRRLKGQDIEEEYIDLSGNSKQRRKEFRRIKAEYAKQGKILIPVNLT